LEAGLALSGSDIAGSDRCAFPAEAVAGDGIGSFVADSREISNQANADIASKASPQIKRRDEFMASQC
jgi:hypothetical protein